MVDLRTISLAAVLCASPASAQPPNGEPPRSEPLQTRLEILGDYAGRLIKFTLDNRIVLDGRGHLNLPGVSWIETVYAAGPVPLRFEIENCPVFEAALTPGGAMYALIVQGCDLKLVQ